MKGDDDEEEEKNYEKFSSAQRETGRRTTPENFQFGQSDLSFRRDAQSASTLARAHLSLEMSFFPVMIN